MWVLLPETRRKSITSSPSPNSLKAAHLGPGLGVPDLHDRVTGPASGALPVPGERHRVHHVRVTRKSMSIRPPLRLANPLNQRQPNALGRRRCPPRQEARVGLLRRGLQPLLQTSFQSPRFRQEGTALYAQGPLSVVVGARVQSPPNVLPEALSIPAPGER